MMKGIKDKRKENVLCKNKSPELKWWVRRQNKGES